MSLSRADVWRNRRPLANRLPPPGKLFLREVRHAWIAVNYYRWWPVVNPRLTYLICLVIASVAIAITRARS